MHSLGVSSQCLAALITAALFMAATAPALAITEKQVTAAEPVSVVFDTDACLDIDDTMALALAHALEDRHEAETSCRDCEP